MSKIDCKVWNKVERLKYAHLKLDGNFTRIRNKRIYSSQGTDLTEKIIALNPNWLSAAFESLQYTLLGEMYYADKPASYIKSGIANGDSSIRFSGFAIENLPEAATLSTIEREYERIGIQFTPYCRLEDNQTSVEYLEKILLPLLHTNFDCGIPPEGFVLKDGNLLNWQKFKLIKTIDCIILGYTPGQGKYKNMIGSIRCGVYNIAHKRIIEIATASGFRDEIRQWLTENGRTLIGKQVVELEYQSVGANGRLRFPQFKTWRDDKLAADCTTEQDLDLFNIWK